ncbi:DUF2256 and DUF3253 domain-containing protein [Acidimicrobiaceae bacterium]|nr:DUF2256 and DUF3253 domain-containing protein [Acidimicrobiaceae bacterium]
MPAHLPSKVCGTCGRSFTWRKKWERTWDEVRYCSKRCRGGPSADDQACEILILRWLNERPSGTSICPSEVARALAFANGCIDDEWRQLLEPARAAARRLVAGGGVVITQSGGVVDPSTTKGPFRIRWA